MHDRQPVFIPYRQHGEPPRRAGISPVDFDLSGLGDSQVQLLGHLCRAADAMNSIFRDQACAETPRITRLVSAMMDQAEGQEREACRHYLDILNLQNGPFSLLPRKNHLLDIPQARAVVLAVQAGIAKEFHALSRYLYQDLSLPEKANFYPDDLTDEVFRELPDLAREVNATVARQDDGSLVAIRNEQRYASACQTAAGHLREARNHTDNLRFRMYLDAKIEELNSGTEEARRIAEYLWIRHDSPIDIVISTAIEVYLDAWKNNKGAAAGSVMVVNREAEKLLRAIIDLVPLLEATAPWTHRRTGMDATVLPRLRFVDVLNWTGDYVTSPMTTIAQSLPNDQWVAKNVGTVNMVYRNTGKAVHRISGDFIAREFLHREVEERYGAVIFEAGQLHSALHEIGHTTGVQAASHPGEPRGYLEEEYSALEEARAELFGMWAMERLADRGLVSMEMAFAGQYSMLLSMITSLKFAPDQAHTKARNMLFHYFDDHRAIVRHGAGAQLRFSLDLEALRDAVESMLRTLGDLKAVGDKAGARAFREVYCFTDPLRPEIEARTKDAPLGRGLLFPELTFGNGRFEPELDYPDFSGQRKFGQG